MEQGKSISIIIPALNEEHGIRETIESLPLMTLRSEGYFVEVLVVDGDSNDDTREVASRLDAKVVVESRKGYGRAYKTGLSAAKGEIIVTLDADGTYPCEMIPDLTSELKTNRLDFLSVNRFAELENGSMSKTHMFGNWILSTTLRFLYSLKIRDSQSGMWVMTRHFVNEVNLLSDDMAFSEEIKIVAFRYFRSSEVGGKYSRRVGQAKLATLGHGMRNLQFLWDYRNKVKYALRSAVILSSPQLQAESPLHELS